MSNVYIVNFAGHNYTEASKFGELKMLTEDDVNTSRFDRLLNKFTKLLTDSSPDDYILPSGRLVLNVIAAIVMYNLHGEAKFLIWNGRAYSTLTMTDVHLDYLLKTHSENSNGEDRDDNPETL